ncbi:type VII secretion protein EssB [Leifsonia shinshuensis]|uniref:Type VII secretion protein EssB n=1 Tax=Leifsonia shinshuensis TaxID=150026 RepID=A0A853CR86_9MICO|nr:type VII secretion protein EssB [Leifsonia shinshuensis]
MISRYVDATETDSGLVLSYALADGETSFRDAVGRARTRLDRLSLAQKLVACVGYRDSFHVPVIHPDNVYLDGALLRVVHCGLQGMLAPMAFDEAHFLASLQAMVLQIFRPKLAFEHLLDGASALNDTFSTAVRQAATTDELFALIGAELKAEQADVEAREVSVPKRRYAGYRVAGALGLAAAAVAGVFAWQTAGHNRLQDAVVASQARFLANDYGGALTELEGFAATSLPASAKYVLAVSSINLDDLTATQKQAILNNISQKSDEVTLNFWIAIGRGEFEQALDYAQNLGDEQLTLLAYTDLYQATKLDAQMAGGKKQELLDKYAKAIDELTAKLEGTSDAAAAQ